MLCFLEGGDCTQLVHSSFGTRSILRIRCIAANILFCAHCSTISTDVAVALQVCCMSWWMASMCCLGATSSLWMCLSTASWHSWRPTRSATLAKRMQRLCSCWTGRVSSYRSAPFKTLKLSVGQPHAADRQCCEMPRRLEELQYSPASQQSQGRRRWLRSLYISGTGTLGSMSFSSPWSR